MDVRVPEMIIKLKQGIGRLIRNFTDTGIVCHNTGFSSYRIFRCQSQYSDDSLISQR